MACNVLPSPISSAKQAPKLLLKGTGDLKESSVGYKDLEITFVEKSGENIYFSDLMNFNPSKGE